MPTECAKQPDLHDYLTGNVLYDGGYPAGDFSWPTASSADNWRLIGHPLSLKAGQILESRATACAAGQITFDGMSIGGSHNPPSAPSFCTSDLPQWGVQMPAGQAAWEDYKERALAFYADYYQWMDTTDPTFMDRLECYDNADLSTMFGMLGEFTDLKGKLTEEEVWRLQNIADGAICSTVIQGAAKAINDAQAAKDQFATWSRAEDLDNLIHAINALDAAGPTGHSLYAWMVSPHVIPTRDCILALFNYDQVMTSMGKPLPESSAAAAAAEEEAAPARGAVVGLPRYTIAAKAKAVAARLRLERAPAPQSMAPPPLAEGAEKGADLTDFADQIAEDNADLAASFVRAGDEEHAAFLQECALNQSGPEVSKMLPHWRGGERAYCPPLEGEPEPEDKRGNLAVILGVSGLVVGGPVGAVAGGALGAWLDAKAKQ